MHRSPVPTQNSASGFSVGDEVIVPGEDGALFAGKVTPIKNIQITAMLCNLSAWLCNAAPYAAPESGHMLHL